MPSTWKVCFTDCNLCLKPRRTGRKPRRCSNKPLSCLFEGNMAHELHKPKNIYRYSEPFPDDAPRVQGYDFNHGVDHKALLQSFYNTGFQATHFGRAVREINRMVRWLKAALCLSASTERQFIFWPYWFTAWWTLPRTRSYWCLTNTLSRFIFGQYGARFQAKTRLKQIICKGKNPIWQHRPAASRHRTRHQNRSSGL